MLNIPIITATILGIKSGPIDVTTILFIPFDATYITIETINVTVPANRFVYFLNSKPPKAKTILAGPSFRTYRFAVHPSLMNNMP